LPGHIKVGTELGLTVELSEKAENDAPAITDGQIER